MKRWALVLAGLTVIALVLLNLRPGDHLSPGVALLKSGEYKKALVELRPHAERGDPVARAEHGIIQTGRAVDSPSIPTPGGTLVAQRLTSSTSPLHHPSSHRRHR